MEELRVGLADYIWNELEDAFRPDHPARVEALRCLALLSLDDTHRVLPKLDQWVVLLEDDNEHVRVAALMTLGNAARSEVAVLTMIENAHCLSRVVAIAALKCAKPPTVEPFHFSPVCFPLVFIAKKCARLMSCIWLLACSITSAFPPHIALDCRITSKFPPTQPSLSPLYITSAPNTVWPRCASICSKHTPMPTSCLLPPNSSVD